MNHTGKIISLAFPDTFVRYSEEFAAQLLLMFGLGKNMYVKAGHAAFVLVENETGKAEYFDFGRYITPQGYGRVRNAITDVELKIPFRAKFTSKGEIANIEDFLLWLEANPEKTHGNGRLVASVCDHIDYKTARDFVLQMQNQGSMPYLTFGKVGSNCSRIVTDTILASTDHPKIRKSLLRIKKFTPSPLGNVEKSSLNNPIYQVDEGVLQVYPGSVLKENLTNYFDKNIPQIVESENEILPDFLKNAHLLKGTGSSAYFLMENSDEKDCYIISRYTEIGLEDFRGLFSTKSIDFDITKPYKFVYDSNCSYCHVEQGGEKMQFNLIRQTVTTH